MPTKIKIWTRINWGYPKKEFGFSNNVMGAHGPASFERAQFDLMPDQKDLDIDIKMKYM